MAVVGGIGALIGAPIMYQSSRRNRVEIDFDKLNDSIPELKDEELVDIVKRPVIIKELVKISKVKQFPPTILKQIYIQLDSLIKSVDWFRENQTKTLDSDEIDELNTLCEHILEDLGTLEDTVVNKDTGQADGGMSLLESIKEVKEIAKREFLSLPIYAR